MKKRITTAAFIVSAFALAGTSVYAASGYTADDLKKLSSALLGETDFIKGQDLTGDNVINVYDLIKMRETFIVGTGEFSEQVIGITDSNTKYIGRNIYDEDGITWLVQSGSAVEFRVNAKSAEITINGDSFIKNSDDHRPRYAIIVDDEIILDELLSEEEKTVVLFDDNSTRTAVVKVIHLSEANNGAVGISSIKVNSNAPIPVAPTAKKELSIEFIGDSITCAYGVEGESQYEGFMTSTENFMKSYAYLTAKQLDADYSAVCYSGHGIVSGYSSTGDAVTDSLVPDYYDYVGKLGSYKTPWDFKSHKNDVVVINLGTNDNTYCSKDYDTRGMEYAEKYAEFLAHVHETNPDAYIICTVGTMGCAEMYPYIETAVESFKNSTGYDRIMSYLCQTQNQSDGYGSDWHPSPVTQQNSAYVLADKICQALGMESSQIGLNVAADAEFSSTQSNGANMYGYYSEWDNSYHITTVTGGTEKADIQAFVSGIDLKKGGKYRLSFKLETSEGEEIPFVIRSKSTGEIIFEDSFTGTGSKTAYEKEFEADVTAADGELVFSLGGTDNLRMSIYEVKAVKFE
ncbi:MAG: carbohydrate binding domain-containing protein [Ruminococcus sp.]|nr:carbohydrate binding domain-containing protein [Ruminococcus sp.]